MSDPLNELKKPTLKRYIRAANKNKDYQYGRLEMETQRGDEKAVKKTEKRLFHRTRGINRAVERLEEAAGKVAIGKCCGKSYVEDLPSGSLKHVGKDRNWQCEKCKSPVHPHKFVEKGSQEERLAKMNEDTQLNELKKSTLKSYINKAAQNLFSKGHSIHKLVSKIEGEENWKSDAQKSATKRAVGISRAVGKLEESKKKVTMKKKEDSKPREQEYSIQNDVSNQDNMTKQVNSQLSSMYSSMTESLTTQAAVRKHFWDNHPHLDKKKIKDYSGKGKMHTTDTRTAFVDHVDSLHRDGHISDKLANSVTLGEDTMPTINPFIIATVNNHPHEAREILSQQMSEKISDALATAKIDYAQNLFGASQIQEEVEPLDEAMTRKHFQMVADTIKANPDAKKRNELAAHHSEIFKKDNPRFDHKRFYAAAGATLKEETVVQKDEKNGVKYTHYGRGTKGPFLTVSKKIKKK